MAFRNMLGSLVRQGNLAGGVLGGPVPTSSMLNSVRYMATKLFVGGTYLLKLISMCIFDRCNGMAGMY